MWNERGKAGLHKNKHPCRQTGTPALHTNYTMVVEVVLGSCKTIVSSIKSPLVHVVIMQTLSFYYSAFKYAEHFYCRCSDWS